MGETIAVFGGSFHPPGIHHRQIAALLARRFDQVQVVPCGPRPDKPVTNDVPPIYRAFMVDMTFRGLERVSVDLFDLESQVFTRTHLLDRKYAARGEVWHVIASDLVVGGGTGQAVIQRDWEQGEQIWRDCRFAVIIRRGVNLVPEDLPPHSEVFEPCLDTDDEEIRDRVFHHRPMQQLVTEEVGSYIERHGLYRGMRPLRTTSFGLEQIRPLLFVDSFNKKAVALAASLEPQDQQNPNLIVVIGGDGTMLRAIRSHWRRRVPFYGVNTGHMGFLLNSRPSGNPLLRDLVLQQLPLLWVTTRGPDGQERRSLAFNDAWVERATGQTAWLRVTVDDRERLPRLVADGALVSTAAGSTSYARAMGAPPMPLNTPALLLVGSNVLVPAFWKQAVLSLESTVQLTTLDPDKRPLHGYVDGVPQGDVRSMCARVSNTAAVELAFDPRHDAAEKLASIQFPLSS